MLINKIIPLVLILAFSCSKKMEDDSATEELSEETPELGNVDSMAKDLESPSKDEAPTNGLESISDLKSNDNLPNQPQSLSCSEGVVLSPLDLSSGSLPTEASCFSVISLGSLNSSAICKGNTLLGTTGSANCDLNSQISFAGITSISNIFSSSVQLNWENNGDFYSYIVSDMTSNPGEVIATVPGSAAKYTVSKLQSNTSYRFKVTALDSTGKITSNSASTSVLTSTQSIPNSVNGLKMWLSSDNIDNANNSTFSDLEEVSQWSDISGNNQTVDQLGSGLKPIFVEDGGSGFSVVRFDGSNDYLKGNFLTALGGSFTMISVAKFSQISQASNDYDYIFNVGGAGTRMAYSQSRSAANWGLGGNLFYSYDGSAAQPGPNLPGGGFQILSSVASSATPFHKLYLDGVSQTVSDFGGVLSVGTSLELGRYFGNTHYLNGEIAELIVYDNSISMVDLKTLECYLSSKYGVTIGHSCD